MIDLLGMDLTDHKIRGLESAVQQLVDKINELDVRLSQSQALLNQLNQVSDQYRVSIYISELKANMLIKMLEEQKILSTGSFDARWPVYLENEVGVIDQKTGKMKGELKVTFYAN